VQKIAERVETNSLSPLKGMSEKKRGGGKKKRGNVTFANGGHPSANMTATTESQSLVKHGNKKTTPTSTVGGAP